MTSRFLSVLFSLTFLALLNVASAQEEKWTPEEEARLKRAEQFGEFYVSRMKEFLKENKTVKPGGTVFLGDSLTNRFPFDLAFPGQNVINRGIGGDKTAGLLDRLDVSLDAVRPSRAYMTIGTNDFLWGVSREDYAVRVRELIRRLSEDLGGNNVAVFTIPPVSRQWTEQNDKRTSFTLALREAADEFNVRVIDLDPFMADDHGALRDPLTLEGIHFSLGGYLAWLQSFATDEEYRVAVRHFAPEWAKLAGGRSHIIDKTDPAPGSDEFGGQRGPDQLVIYTPNYYQPTTGTNYWGTEAVVEEGVVIRIGQNDSRIPENGFVISAHGTASTWLAGQLRPGDQVGISNGRLIQVAVSEPKDEWDVLWREQASLMEELAKALADNKPTEAIEDRLVEIRKQITNLPEKKRLAALY